MKLFTLMVFTSLALGAEEPSLPIGLEGQAQQSSEPTFLFDETPQAEEKQNESQEPWFDYSGFLDFRFGSRLQEDLNEKDISLGELRLHNDFSKEIRNVKLKFVGDILVDGEANDIDNTNLRDGTGVFDLRELNASFSPASFVDLKVGRQVLTWGTGDLIFINDLFPKDWKSFFVGRDLTYLKAPSDAIKGSFYTEVVNIDLIYTPLFNSDRHIDGTRNSYYSPILGKKVGRKTDFNKQKEESGEFATRLSKTIGSTELAFYGYKGFWKSPMGINSQGEYYFPKLNVYGASVRSPLWGGIGNLEGGYYDSKEDHLGSNLNVPNDEVRLLAGYEHELIKNTTGSVQYYVEQMQDYDAYRSTFRGADPKDESRHMITAKVRKEMLSQTLSLTPMVFYSPTDQDGHYRVNLDYKKTDNLKLFLGVNGFFGEKQTTFWGQFEDNTNAYAGITYNF